MAQTAKKKPAKRPQKRAAQQRKSGKPDDLTLGFKLGERVYVVRANELSGLEASLLRREIGMSLRAILAAAEEDMDVDVLAALVWVALRQEGAQPTFAEVAQSITYADLETLDELTGDELAEAKGEAPDPTPAGGA